MAVYFLSKYVIIFPMQVTVTPPIRNAFELARMGREYVGRLHELLGSDRDIVAAHDDYIKHPSPLHPFDKYCEIAHQEATKDLLPSERHIVSFIHRYDVPDRHV